MNEPRFWIGGYTSNPMPEPWLLATDVNPNGKPYLCCKCPCVEYYAIFAFRTIELTGASHNEYNWCMQATTACPMGVDNLHHVHLDYLPLWGMVGSASVTMTINANAATGDECGRTTVSLNDPLYLEAKYYEVRAYRLTQKYYCYDDFRAMCFSQCTNLPCDEYDQLSGTCTHHYLPDTAMVFNGQRRPCWGLTSNAMSQYYCLDYWHALAESRYHPNFNIALATMDMTCTLNGWRHWYDGTEYAAMSSIGGTQSYHTAVWSTSQGTEPNWTTSENVGFLSDAISEILPMVRTARATDPSTWAVQSSQSYSYQICKEWSASSYQYCISASQSSLQQGMSWYWQCVRATLTKSATAPTDSTGIKIWVKQTIRHYDGGTDSDPIMPQPTYTETTTVETRDVQWGVAEYFTIADALTIQASATACSSGEHAPACITPCEVDGHGYPHETVTVSIQGMDYLYGSPSDWSSSS